MGAGASAVTYSPAETNATPAYNPGTFFRELLNCLNIAQRGWCEGVRLDAAKEGLYLIDLFRKTEPDPQKINDMEMVPHWNWHDGKPRHIARGMKHRLMAQFYGGKLEAEKATYEKIKLARSSS